MKKTEKIKYEIDPHNKLIYKKSGKESQVPYFRTVVDGKFKIDKNNQLTYHVKKSKHPDIPQQLKLKGKWSLDKDHNLVFTLDKWGNQIAGNKLTIKSEISDVKSNKLAFAVAGKDSQGKTRLYTLKLNGAWQADKYNRLTFKVKKEKDTTDELTLKGGWQVNKHNEIIYVYTKSYLKTKTKTIKTVTFKGYWNITEKHRITYVLDKKIDSQFDFKVSLRQSTKKSLQYRIGIGVTPAKKTITLFGKWKVNKKLGLIFEMPYEKGKLRSIIFGASAKLDKNYKLNFKLENDLGEDLGIEVKLSKNILKNQGEAFIKALKKGKEVSIVAGAGFRW